MKIQYNCTRKLKSYTYDICMLMEFGFKPIAVAQMYLEDTFVFETDEEAKKAFEDLEYTKPGLLSGWFYSRESFEQACSDYKKEVAFDYTIVRTYWIDTNSFYWKLRKYWWDLFQVSERHAKIIKDRKNNTI